MADLTGIRRYARLQEQYDRELEEDMRVRFGDHCEADEREFYQECNICIGEFGLSRENEAIEMLTPGCYVEIWDRDENAKERLIGIEKNGNKIILQYFYNGGCCTGTSLCK